MEHVFVWRPEDIIGVAIICILAGTLITLFVSALIFEGLKFIAKKFKK